MKKLLLITFSIIVSLGLYSQKDLKKFSIPQPENNLKISPDDAEYYSWAKVEGNFNVKDINGETHDLQAYLDAGKTVIVDLSAVWCGPCWRLHQSGIFENLQKKYGPEGTDELVILWVEMEGASLSLLQGKGSNTQGDWTEKGTWPVPIISSTQVAPCFKELYAGSVPTVFMACPSGYYRDITSETWDGMSQVYANVGKCPAPGKLPIVKMNGGFDGYPDSAVELNASTISIDPITSYSWTFEGGTPSSSTEEAPKTVWSEPGEYEIIMNISNSTGPTQLKRTITIHDISLVNDMFVTFEEITVNTILPNTFYPYKWTTVDNDKGVPYNNFNKWGVQETSAIVAYNHKLVNSEFFKTMPTNKVGLGINNVPASSLPKNPVNNDWFISPKFQLGTDSKISLDVISGYAGAGSEQYKIAVSTTDNDPASFTILKTYSTTAQWKTVTTDLSKYDGQEVYIAIVYSRGSAFFLMDNIQIITTPLGINNDNEVNNIAVYPNPITDNLSVNGIEGYANLTLTDISGKVVMETKVLGNQPVNVQSLPDGIYIVRIENGQNIIQKKIIKK